MDFETFIQSLFNFLKNSENLYFVTYAIATCLLTQVVKKLVVNKVKVDILHNFDFAVVLPFIFGGIFAILDAFVFFPQPLDFSVVPKIAVSTATIGALSSVIFKFFASLSGKSLKSLLKDDTFGIFYNQLLYFGNVRKQLVNNEISMQNFVDQVKVVSANAVAIYTSDLDEDGKRAKLYQLLQGIVSEDSITVCVNVINKALIALFGNKTE